MSRGEYKQALERTSTLDPVTDKYYKTVIAYEQYKHLDAQDLISEAIMIAKEDLNETSIKLLSKLYLYSVSIYLWSSKRKLAMNMLETYKSLNGPQDTFNEGFELLILGQFEEKHDVAIEYFLKSAEKFEKVKGWWYFIHSYLWLVCVC